MRLAPYVPYVQKQEIDTYIIFNIAKTTNGKISIGSYSLKKLASRLSLSIVLHQVDDDTTGLNLPLSVGVGA